MKISSLVLVLAIVQISGATDVPHLVEMMAAKMVDRKDTVLNTYHLRSAFKLGSRSSDKAPQPRLAEIDRSKPKLTQTGFTSAKARAP